jgi:hypothetical protein
VRALETATTCGDEACLQHECEAGMAEVSHMLAIFKQQLCSSSVISCPAVTQATSGCPKSSSISVAATIFEALLNIVILPHYAKKIALLQVAFPARRCQEATLALSSLLLVLRGLCHILVQRS